MMDWRLLVGRLISPRKDWIEQIMLEWRKFHRYRKHICDCSNMSAYFYKLFTEDFRIATTLHLCVGEYSVYICCSRTHCFLCFDFHPDDKVGRDKTITRYYDPVFAADVTRFVGRIKPWKPIEFIGDLETAIEIYGKGEFDANMCDV